MKITILGATGLVGKQLLQEAVKQGYSVTVLVRNPQRADDMPNNVKVVVGDYFEPKDVARAISGSEAVLSTIGPINRARKGYKPQDYANALAQLISAMEGQGIRRLINLASTGTRYVSEHINVKRALLRATLSVVAPNVIPTKEAELNILVKSSLNWTSIRPPLIDDKATGEFYVGTAVTQGWRVNTLQLCQFMLKQLTDDQWERQAPFVGTR